MSVYRSDPERAPDSRFEAGVLAHLVRGNTGRLLDPRRTPVTVVEIRPAVGAFVVRIDAFEDEGATWEIPFDGVRHYQFARGASRATPGQVSAMERAIARFDRPLEIPADPDAGAATRMAVGTLTGDARTWLARRSRFFSSPVPSLPDPARREGAPLLQEDLHAYLDERDLDGIETAFARRFVSNPDSGEMVKGHRIVIAELGLATFTGRVVRDPELFAGEWSRERRAEHVLARLAFVRATFELLGRTEVALWRGLSTPEPLRPPTNRTFVSATFDRAVARSHFGAAGADSSGLLVRATVPVERLFMTYYETSAMNAPFREAEAVVFHDENALAL